MRKNFRTTRLWRDNSLILREFKYFKTITVIATIFIIVGALLEGATVGAIASFLQGLTNPTEPPLTTGIEWIDVWILATKASPTHRVYRLSALIFVAVLLRSVFSYVGVFYSRLCEFSLSNRIRQRLFNQLKRTSLSFYFQVRSGELINTLTSEVGELKQAFAIFSVLMIRGTTLLAYVTAMFWISWQLSIAAVMLFGLLSVGLSNLVARIREASFAVPKTNGKLTSISVEFINGISTIKAFATQELEQERFSQAQAKWFLVNKQVAILASAVKPLSEVGAIAILLGMVLAAYQLFIVNNDLRAASLLSFMFILFRMMPLVAQVNQARENLSKFQGSIDNIKNLLRTDNKSYLKDGKQEFVGLRKSIDFVSVDFAYNSEQYVLQDVTLSIEKGQTTALVGASGAGKTTLADLIPRFYDTSNGSILLDGVDLRNFKLNSLRRKIAIVSQDTFIFNNTIEYNIAYGTPEATKSMIMAAAKQANVWEFVQNLPEGFETNLGDRGVKLSGGQRQRIAIARAILRNPDILILDEATSALDSITEKLIQESLEKLTLGKTVIAIAHRLSTITNADKVVVIEQGRIVEQGKYQELLGNKGELWKYHQMQHKDAFTS